MTIDYHSLQRTAAAEHLQRVREGCRLEAMQLHRTPVRRMRHAAAGSSRVPRRRWAILGWLQ